MVNTQGRGQEDLPKPFAGFTPRGQNMPPHQRCVAAGAPCPHRPRVGDKDRLKIPYPNALQLQTRPLTSISATELQRENRQRKILCANANMICKTPSINLPQSQFCMHKEKNSWGFNLGGRAAPLPPSLLLGLTVICVALLT